LRAAALPSEKISYFSNPFMLICKNHAYSRFNNKECNRIPEPDPNRKP
jgi:hypothetical protein